MKGYNTDSGYMGYVEGKYILFVTEAEYVEYMETEEDEDKIKRCCFMISEDKLIQRGRR